MVADINYGNSLYGVLAYNEKKVKEQSAVVLGTNRIIENMDPDRDLRLFLTLKSFEPYLLANKRTKTPITHISINPALEDNLTDEQLVEITKEYLDRMGYGKQPYILYKHMDTDRVHLHVVTVRIDENGKKIEDSNDRFRNLAVCRDLEIKYGLRQLNGKEKEQDVSRLRKVDYQKGNIKQVISNTLKGILKEYRFQTLGEYNALLSCFNIHSKYVRGEEEDRKYNGIIYSATNDKGEIVGKPIKSSRIGMWCGYNALNEHMRKTTDRVKQGKVQFRTQKLISSLMKKSPDLDTFQKNLQFYQMDVIFRINDTGRITGVTFVDHKSKLVYNGSRLGKEYSANHFNSLYADPMKPRPSIPEAEPLQQPAESTALDLEPLWDEFFEFEMEPLPDLDEVFGTFHLRQDRQDLELEFRKSQRKRRRRRKL